MSSMDPPNPAPLDESLYSLDGEESGFFKSQTRINDEGELKKHILAVQAKAYKVFPYPCIYSLWFTKLPIFRSPYFVRALQLTKERKGAILVDAGCNFGHDARAAISAGWPLDQVVAFDLEKAFWDYGHELFRTTPETFPATFVAGDVLDPSLIAPHAPFYGEPPTPQPDPRSLKTSLTPLQGHVAAIHACALFHLFDEEKQLQVARQLASLLSPLPGSIIFGLQPGMPVKGPRTDSYRGTEHIIFCHSPESWQNLWDGQVFAKGRVRVDSELKEVKSRETAEKFYFLVWCITRI